MSASYQKDGTIIVFASPDDDIPLLATVNLANESATTVSVVGDVNIGEVQCSPTGVCHGIVNTAEVGSGGMQKKKFSTFASVSPRSGETKTVLTLSGYIGYSVGSSVLDPAQNLYHVVLVGKIHKDSTDGNTTHTLEPQIKNDQYLVTIDLNKMEIVSEVPVTNNFMGPFVVSQKYGLMTFGSDKYDNSLVQVEPKTGRQVPLLKHIGDVPQFCATSNGEFVVAYSVFPAPPRLLTINLAGNQPTVVRKPQCAEVAGLALP